MNYVIIVAGGSGKRMGSEIPKQFLLLREKPILMYTLETFSNALNEIEIILVLPESQIDYWKELCKTHNFSINHSIVVGGKERYHSVENGLNSIQGRGVVGVHDGVRPFISKDIIINAFEKAKELRAVTLSVPLKDSIREVHGDTSKAVDRSNYQLIQTPQIFDINLLKKAFDSPYQNSFTDDASVVESFGHKVHLIPGDYNNIKITSPEDMVFGEAILKSLTL